MKVKINKKWIFRTFLMTFVLAIIFSIISESLIRNVNVVFAFVLLLLIITIGIFFDAIGISVAAADEKPFHAMAASKIESARYAVILIKNASKVSNFCNDVVGDIAGIISGTTIGIIIGFFDAYQIAPEVRSVISIVMSGMVAGLTVGGKAIGKEIAISHAKEVVGFAGKVIYFFKKVTTLETYVSLFRKG